MQVLDYPTLEIAALPPEGDDRMAAPTNKERLDGIEERLVNIEAILELKPSTPKKKFLARRYEWAVNHKGAALIWSLILCLAGIFGGGWFKYYLDHKDDAFNKAVDGRIGAELAKPDGLTHTLAGVQGTVNDLNTTLKALAPFIHDVINHQFDNASKLPTATLQERLPAVQHLLAVAHDQGIKANAPVLDALGRKLNTVDTKADSFWPTAAQFINYRSQIISRDIQSLMRSDLPNCTDHDPTPMKLIVSEEEAKNGKANDTGRLSDLLNETDKNKTHMVSAAYQDCRFTLDSPEETAQVPNLGEQRSYVLTFRHCQIVYRGGQIKLLTTNPHPTAITGKSQERSDVYMFVGQIVRFDNCLFVFVMNSRPPSEGQSLTKQLLAQGGSTLTVKSATHS